MSDAAFAQVIEWARYYARVGLSVIPTAKGQKSPGVAWERFQERCPTGSEINSWFTNFYRECGCGMVTGQVSRNIFVIDADAGPGKQGVENLDELQMLHDDLPDTWQAKSGGGGRHYFLQAPPHLRIKTGKNVLGLHVDVRGEGGFIVLAPSMHPSGNRYEWIPGMDPSSNTPIAMAPDWLLNLVVDTAPQPAVRPDRPVGSIPDEKDYLSEFNAFGMRVDGREQYMRDLIWARLLEERRDSPIPPAGSVLETILAELWEVYERKVKARGGSLDADRRGIGEMRRKLGYALKKWDTRIATDAGKPKPGGDRDGINPKQASGPTPPKSPINTVDFYTLYTEQVVEEPDYIEPAFAGPGNFVLIAGPPKAQKSFLLQEMLVACATGGPCLAGVLSVPRPLRVFYLQAEMNRKLLRKRAREFSMLSGEQRELLKINLIMSERFSMILNDDGVQTAIDTIKAAFPNEPPDIIAVDPLANLFDGDNENDNTQLMRFLGARLEVIRQKINPLACIVLVHHSAKKGVEDLARDPFVAIRGAGSLRGYYDSAIVIYKKSEEGRVRRVHFELRGGESPEPLDVELASGRFQKLIATDGLPSKDACRKILQEIRVAWNADRPWSPYPQSRKEGRYAQLNMAMLFEVPADAATRLLDEWMKNRVITFRERESRKRPAGFEVTGSID